ncbi:unnamed protein product [Ceratitis capitata]|uniref:(Mediterranean fruit fly) hypothetical protein n=1 Tax=Ceratitis capitata TaxID=7213 RepID=A0A811UW28_CERCA|nr:unnamed protein product [Ceratitis capitata]
MKHPCNFSMPISWQKYSKQHPWRQTLERCRKQLKGGGILEEFGRIPGFSERTIRSVLFEEDFTKDKKRQCKCGDAWTTHDHLGSLVPFSANMVDQEPLTAEQLLLQELMKKMGFLTGGTGDDIGWSEKELMRRWLDELNKFYNLRNNNALKHGKGNGKKYELNYLDYSLLKYEGIDDSESEVDEEEDERKRRRKAKPPAELTGAARDDINHMKYRLRSITKQRKTKIEALLFYSPFVKQMMAVGKVSMLRVVLLL